MIPHKTSHVLKLRGIVEFDGANLVPRIKAKITSMYVKHMSPV
jgi:hypothetical protein